MTELRPKRILIVEDSDLDFEQAQIRLMETGQNIEIVRATRLSEAEKILSQRKNFDVVFLDPGLPDVVDSKYEAYGRLCRFVDPAIIQVVTGNDDTQMKEVITNRGSQVLSKDSALRGEGMVEAAFGVEFIIDRMKSYEGRISEQVNNQVDRVTVPFKHQMETEMGRVRLQVAENRKALMQLSKGAEELSAIKMQLKFLSAAVSEAQAALKDIKKTQSESEARVAIQLERTKGFWSGMPTILIALITALVTLISSGKLPLPILGDRPAETPENPVPNPNE